MTNKSKQAAKRGNIYETVSNNIQKITRPSGTTSYRVRVTEDGVNVFSVWDFIKESEEPS